jgi:hypothetical protein
MGVSKRYWEKQVEETFENSESNFQNKGGVNRMKNVKPKKTAQKNKKQIKT